MIRQLILYISIALLICTIDGARWQPALATSNSDASEARFNKAVQSIKKKNYKSAHKHLHHLAKKHHAKSLTLLGLLYEKGVGVEKDWNKAFLYYKESAEAGLPEGESRLGHFLLDCGEAIEQDSNAAFQWLEKAANHGVAEAQATLGELYYQGSKLPKNNSQAARWLKQAADQGNAKAQETLSRIPAVDQGNWQMHQAGNQYQSGMVNLERSWKGYADIVNTVNAASQYRPSQ